MSAEPPYSRTRTAAGLLFLAGILGRDDGGLPDGFRAQLDQAFYNLEDQLADHDVGTVDVVRLVVFLTDIEDTADLNESFIEHFAEPRPVRSTVAVSALPGGALVEIEATASI
ncbi:MAG: RidA family protein [Microthrixaceae bacterium]